MDLIENFEKDINNIIGEKEAFFKVRTSYLNVDTTDKSMIYQQAIKYGTMLKGVLQISFSNERSSDSLFKFKLSEFPDCCGKAILSSIELRKTWYKNAKLYGLDNTDFVKICKRIFQFIEDVLIIKRYSSFDFILSDVENSEVYEIIEELGFKYIGEFKNRRNNYTHNLRHYSVIFRNISKKEEIEMSLLT